MSEFDRFFGGSPNLASTYKPTFLKCLLDIGNDENIEGSQWITQRENEYEVGLDFIAARFIYYYWPLNFIFKLKQAATPSPIAVYRILNDYSDLFILGGRRSQPTKEKLCNMDNDFVEMRKEIIVILKRDVLDRLLNDCDIYTIHSSRSKIIIPKEIVSFMKENKNIIFSALNYTIAEYLEGFNTSPNISRCLKEEIRRTSLTNDEFAEMIKMQNSCCFYCGCPENKLREENGTKFFQDHLIPWNFVRETKNYNIVPACFDCNSDKSDKLPAKEYLNAKIDSNKSLEAGTEYPLFELPYGYRPETMLNRYGDCLIEYHGSNQELWKPEKRCT